MTQTKYVPDAYRLVPSRSGSSSLGRDRGAALVVGLILLLILTVLAISGMTTASLELQMAGNAQYQERAFQAADTGIERAIAQQVYSTATPTTVTATSADVTASEGDTFEAVVEFDNVGGVTSVPGGGYSLGTGLQAYHFVVTSRGESARGATSEHVQSFYVVGPGGT